MKNILIALALFGSVAPAAALELGRPGNSVVFVWKDTESSRMARQFVEMGRYNDAIALAACVPSVGTRAVKTDSPHGIALVPVKVVSGRNVGCEGVVAIEDVR